MLNVRPTRRWLRFSLRTFLIVVTLFCVWAAWYVDRARRQKDAVEAVRAYGGWVYYDFQNYDPDTGKCDPQRESPLPDWLIDTFGVDMFHRVEAVNLCFNDDTGKRLENPNLSDDVIPYFESFPSLRALYAHKSQVTDETMQPIGKLRKLECLMIWDAERISDEGVAHLGRLNRLKVVHISESHLGDQSLAVLGSLPRVERLSLQGNRFTNEGLKHLAGARGLKSLWIGLGAGEITDDGVAHLAALNKLEELDLQRYVISDTGIRVLAQLPNLRFLTLGYRTSVTDAGLLDLLQLKYLEHLTLASADISSQAWERLAELKTLKSLSIGPHITKDHLLYKALPSCRIDYSSPPGWRG